MGFNVMSLARSISAGLGLLAAAIATGAPYWFLVTVKISFDGGSTFYDKELNVGLFYMVKGEDTYKYKDQEDEKLIYMIMLDKVSNAYVLPGMMRVGQIFFALAMFGIVVCFGASMILLLKRYSSVEGELLLAGSLTGIAAAAIIGVVLPGISTEAEKDVVWNRLPIPKHFQLIEATPNVTVAFALYIAALAAVLIVIAAFISWIQACSLCKHVEEVRYQQLHDSSITEKEVPTFQSYGKSLRPYYAEKGDRGFYSVEI
ncbi:hypothetical protein CHS0354_018077 [Potamilus streckersoni]|uniref:Uncharacterized protein n=1 Tax=Potamilus streckersoni TaxID=2493646 RepID=A0AAE0TJM6_9BIVA|nr:hypothetical protein CHS0354_018077 [Potamilus streckersoni]